MDLLTPGLTSDALFSIDRAYRYALWRTWNARAPLCNFIMLNPSSADEIKDDTTIGCCIRYAKLWGYGAIIVTNLFALRSTDPSMLYKHANPIGSDNDEVIAVTAFRSSLVVCAWGNHGKLHDRGNTVLKLLAKARVTCHALRMNKNGTPAHPLYLPSALLPEEMI